MRADMFKVIVERPRWGSRNMRSAKLSAGRDHDRKFIGLKRHALEQVRSTKGFNENLAPLFRFVCKQVGRRWDDVFSEICEHLDTGSTVKMHVRTHLKDFVVINISRGRKGELISDGYVLEPGQRHGWWGELYVDPDDGLLKDRVWFWRDHGRDCPTKKRDCNRGWAP